MKVIVKSTTMVKPAEPTPQHRLWLSNLDLKQPKLHFKTIYVYNKPSPSSSPSSSVFFDTKLLKEALSKALVPFYPVAGRLGRDAINGRLEVDCNGEGVLFQEAETETTAIADLGDFLPGDELTVDQLAYQLVPRVDYSMGLSSYPLFLVQITRFKCGGVCLGIMDHHTISDGASALSFMTTWSNMARGLPVTTTPYLDRTTLRARNPPTPKFHHTEYDPYPTLMNLNNNNNNNNNNHDDDKQKPVVVIRILKITPHQLAAIKEKAGSQGTTFEILSAHIWRCASQARGLARDQPTKLCLSVDGRARLNRPPVPREYFGNVVFHTAAHVARAGELVTEPVARTVERVRAAISRMDDEYLRSAVDWLESAPESKCDDEVQVLRRCCSPNVKVVSWMRLPFDIADFGWGRPVMHRKAGQYGEGTAHLLPVNGDGNISLLICLEVAAMEAFQRLLYEV